jgi:iron(III) transport system ATP-binding protein
VTVAIRPEDIVVRDVEGGTENAFEAEIAGLEFLGAYVRARLEAPELCAGELRADLSADVVRRMGLAEGRRLPIVLPRARLRIFPRD